MCKHEVIGDFYRGCGHFHGRYFTGEVKDCESSECRASAMHKHKSTRKCQCPEVSVYAYMVPVFASYSHPTPTHQVIDEERKVQNMFQVPFTECQRTTR
ncbi:hypothetical protein C0991_007055 [Blastosporella zonata]|nr:hypothetical protein C0991_007055 [Blastosporella zonata]